MCTPSTGAIVEGEREAKAKNPFCAIWHHFRFEFAKEKLNGRRTRDVMVASEADIARSLQDEE